MTGSEVGALGSGAVCQGHAKGRPDNSAGHPAQPDVQQAMMIYEP